MSEPKIQIATDKIVSKNPKVQIRAEAADKFLLFNLENHETLIINETGKFVWESCDGKVSISDIIEKVKSDYEVKNEQIENLENIIMEFIQLLEIKLLVKVN